ncbi:MAG: iron-sulfur cluster assembly accessory protein [Calditrichaeota bacterium]|nr:iron-sulfur cluster assembly accessory protein [Calditrichota bacterium]
MDVNVKISERAAAQIAKLLKAEGLSEDAGLRVGVKSGGCSGLSYYMEFKQEPLPNDHIIEAGTVRIFVDVFSAMYLNGSELDFTDGLNGTGFAWSNPNAARSCGCGQSFST